MLSVRQALKSSKVAALFVSAGLSLTTPLALCALSSLASPVVRDSLQTAIAPDLAQVIR